MTHIHDSAPVASVTPPALLDVQAVAAMLDCSTRHVYRLNDAGRMPAALKVGALVRWSRQAIDSWIVGGCKPVRQRNRA